MMRGLRRSGVLWVVMSVTAVTLVGSGCKGRLISKSDEVKLGQDAGDDFERKYGRETNAQMNALVRAIGANIERAAEPPDYPYDYRVLADKTTNAVAFPGAGQSALTYVPVDGSLWAIHQEWGTAGLYKIQVQGDKLYATLDGSDDLYQYDVATDSWVILTDALPFTFGGGDDIAGVGIIPEPGTMLLVGLGLLGLLIRRKR